MNPDELFADVFEKYSQHLNPGLAKLMGFAGFGVEVYAEGCYITDHEGRRFLDCLGGYGTFALGHRPKGVIEAVKAQMDRMPLSGKAFFSKPAADLAAKLAALAPGDLQFCFFSNSGAEAVEAALKFAKGATGRSGIVSTVGSYHGKTLGALATTGREKYRKKFEPLMPGVSFVPFGDAEALRGAVTPETAAVILEPIQGEGGIMVPPDGYLRAARTICDANGALLIFDEVQSGMGRTGTLFACEHEGVAPDLLTLAKALGGGVMPIGATLGTEAVFSRVYSENPLAHTSTFGGNQLACAAALATLDEITSRNLPANSAAMGQRLIDGFKGIQSRFPEMIAEVRGRGLMVGLEFAMDEVGEVVVSQLLKCGLCVAYALNNPRVLRFEPPLIITEEQIDFAVRTVETAIAETDALLSALV